MSFAIDSTSYPKAKTYPPRHGYQLRGTTPTSIVVHSTSNTRKNTAFAGEAKYLYESAAVSAHFLVGKDGKIVRFLEPAPWQAWHAGEAKSGFGNSRSIGIELHHSVGDAPYPQLQIDALTWLVKDLMGAFRIPTGMIETHRAIALPAGRKHDPHDWSDSSFYAWRTALVPSPPGIIRYVARHTEAIQEAPRADAPVALADTARVPEGAIIEVDEVRPDGYLHLASGVGFVRKGVFSKV
jgi:N-acetylmuramoyl-L-alanine amidase CwlA